MTDLYATLKIKLKLVRKIKQEAMVCRVCLDKSELEISIYDEESDDIANIIEKHFWFKPLRDDAISTLICLECWRKIRDFHEYYETVEKSHTLFFEQQAVKAEPDENAADISQFETVECSEQSEEQSHLNERDALPDKEPAIAIKNECGFENEAKFKRKRKINPANSISPLKSAHEKIKSNVSKKLKPLPKPTSSKSEPKHLSSLTMELKKMKAAKSRQEQRCWSNAQTEEIMRKHLNMNCDICSFPTSSFIELEKHFKESHTGVKAYIQCCGRRFNKKQRAAQHALRHEDPCSFQCPTCNKVFASLYSLRSHTTSYHPAESELLFECDQCDKRFPRAFLLDYHKAKHVPEEERQFSCAECEKTFANQHMLKAHISTKHTSAQVCHICAKSIIDKAAFEKHVRLHFEESGPRVQCPHPGCDKYLKDEDNLKIHMRRHKQENMNVSCDQCGKVVKNRLSLISHKHYAHTERVFPCNLCPSVFKRQITLKEHMAAHTGEPLYKCPFCERKFNSNANMHSHKKKQHPVEWDNWRKTKTSSSQTIIKLSE